MKPIHKSIIKSLLVGCYLRKTSNHNGILGYKLYTTGASPISFHRERTIDAIGRKLPYKIFKSDKHGRVFLHLGNVRRLHGRTILKQLYKKHRNEQVKK